MSLHPFDAALQLQPQADGSYLGATSPAWANMVGPFGGITAATVVHAIVGHDKCLGSPVALTLNYVSAIADGAFRLLLRIARTNRSTQHWVFEIQQTAANGSVECVLTGTAMTAQRRDTWSANDLPMPQVPAPETLPEAPLPKMVEWFTRYEMRAVSGSLPQVWDGSESESPAHEASLSQLWVRDRAGRALDFAALAATADIFFPRIWRRRATWTPAGTVSMTVYFHADSALLAQVGTRHVLGVAKALNYRHGYFDQTGELWSPEGQLLASTHQLVYFKD